LLGSSSKSRSLGAFTGEKGGHCGGSAQLLGVAPATAQCVYHPAILGPSRLSNGFGSWALRTPLPGRGPVVECAADPILVGDA
jgi:hypothetical protein